MPRGGGDGNGGLQATGLAAWQVVVRSVSRWGAWPMLAAAVDDEVLDLRWTTICKIYVVIFGSNIVHDEQGGAPISGGEGDGALDREAGDVVAEEVVVEGADAFLVDGEGVGARQQGKGFSRSVAVWLAWFAWPWLRVVFVCPVLLK